MNQAKAETSGTSTPPLRAGRRLHPLPVRIMHWINAVVMLVMITSGWGIYDDDVVIRGVHFSQFWRLGDWAAWSLNWHFAGMWFLTINGLIYLAYGFASGRLREKLLPIRPAEIVQTIVDTLHFKIAHEDITEVHLQRLVFDEIGYGKATAGNSLFESTQEAERRVIEATQEIARPLG